MKAISIPNPKKLLNTAMKDPAKAVPYVIGGIIVIALSIAVIRRIRRGKVYDVIEQKKEIDTIEITKSNLTISDGQAVLISQNLLNAMNPYGTDEEAIYNNLESLQTKDDLLLVIKKFGIKPYDGAGLADTWASKKFFSTDKNLQGWLHAELSRRELERVKAVFTKLNVPF